MKESVCSNAPSVIVVDDDKDLRDGLAEYLQLRGFNVGRAATGVEFHFLLKTQRYDIAILDVNLPDASGFDLARVLSNRNDIGIIILTAQRTRDDRLRGYGDGADLFFTKPVDSEELTQAALNLVKRVQRERNGLSEQAKSNLSAPKYSRQGSWILNRNRQILVSPDGSNIQLSVRETMLLEFFARYPLQTIKRIDVLRFYDPSITDLFSRRFDVAFGRLRSKAKQAGLELPVQVIRGAGVRVVDVLEVI